MPAPLGSIRYVGAKPMDFCVVTPLAEMAGYAAEMATETGISTCIAISEVENDVEVALAAIRNENVRLLATRGYTEYYLRRNCDVPILSIGYSAENFFKTLLPYQNSGMTVGHLCFPGQGLRFMRIAGLLGLNGRRIEVESREGIGEVLADPAHRDIAMFIGGLGVITRVRGLGYDGIPLLSETREVVRQTFMDASAMLAIMRANEDRSRFIQTILDTSPNIIMYVDEGFTISYASKNALETFSSLRMRMPAAPLSAIFPDTDFAAVFADALNSQEPGLLLDCLKREFLFNLAEINPHNGPRGYILSLNSVRDLRRSERALRKKQPATVLHSLEDIAGKSVAIKNCRKMAARYAASNEPVLIMGETGVGKEMFAQAIHRLGKRGKNPFMALNCASLSETLLESELFGYEDGAFTNARRGGKQGLLELANGGTLFLDEIGEMPLAVQARLLRVLQSQIFMRIGGMRHIAVDVRIICATNRKLRDMLEAGTFRKDLYYRINTLPLVVPPLAERPGDIGMIAEKFASENSISITRGAMAKLLGCGWPGNARELLHVLKRAAILAEGREIEAKDIVFDGEIFGGGKGEAARIEAALVRNGHRRSQTARELGISRTSLWKKMREYNLLPPKADFSG